MANEQTKSFSLSFRFKIFSTVLAILSFVIGCGDQKSRKNWVQAPAIEFQCDSIQSSLCGPAGDGKPVFIGLIEDLDFDCETELLGLSPLLLPATFDYSGLAQATFNGVEIQGVVNLWANSAGAKMLNIKKTTYRLCAFLDSDEDGQLDAGEVLAEEDFDPSDATYHPVTSWSHL